MATGRSEALVLPDDLNGVFSTIEVTVAILNSDGEVDMRLVNVLLSAP